MCEGTARSFNRLL